MIELKQVIAATIVCFKPQIFLVICIILVIVHSIFQAIHRGEDGGIFIARQPDLTLTMTTVVIIVALIWGALFVFLIKYELRTEVECLLTLFHCSKRGLRFLGVVAFHVGLVVLVAVLVSMAVEKTVPLENNLKISNGRFVFGGRQNHRSRMVEYQSFSETSKCTPGKDPPCVSERKAFISHLNEPERHDQTNVREHHSNFSPEGLSYSIANMKYISTVYKIWLTAIVYAFLYVVLENLIMFHADMSLIEFVHEVFHNIVTKLTGIDLSDYPAGEMLINPLVRRRFR